VRKVNSGRLALGVVLLVLTVITRIEGAEISVTHLRCEYLADPLGIDVPQPRLSWVVPNAVRGDMQTAYRIKVSSSRAGNGDLWDSGKVASEQSIHVRYAGQPLQSGQRCFWTVETFGKDGASHGVSEVATWSMGLLNKSDWQGKWIHATVASNNNAHIWYRKKVVLDNKVDSAVAYVASRGFHELYINGKKVDDRVLAPTLTGYQKRIHYVTYDISQLLNKGENVIAVWYGPGWANFSSYNKGLRAIRAQVNVVAGGKAMSVSTDSSWKWKLSSSEHMFGWGLRSAGGEKIYAGRLEPNWNTVGYDDSSWSSSTEADMEVALVSEMIDPDRVIGTVSQVEAKESQGRYEFTLEKNFTGFLELSLKGQPNTEATILVKNRKSNPKDDFKQISSFVFDERGEGVFRHRFNYQSGRYIYVTNVTEMPTLKAVVVSTDFKQVGSFESSNKLLNQIYETDLWTFRACTLNGVTMDCPHRERLGYGEVAFVTSWGNGLPNYEAGSFYTKRVQDWMDVIDVKGLFVAPTPHQTWGGPMWSSAPVTLTYETYRAYGDTDIISKSYETMKTCLNRLAGRVRDGILASGKDNFFLGEWSAPNGRKNNGKSREASLFNNCVYAMVLDMFVEMAGVVGKSEDVKTYAARRDSLRANIHKSFFNEADNTYINTIQTHLAFPLLAGVTPPEKRAAVMKNFEKEILETTPYLDMGSSGISVLLKFLLEYAQRGDIVNTHLNKTTQPSYGYFLSNGETTWPEYWAGDCESKIHTCYTGIASFYQKGVLGILNAPSAIGYKHFHVKPGVYEGLDWARGSQMSMYGVIRTGWEKHKGGGFSLNVNVPGNTTAEVFIPKPKERSDKWTIRETQGVCWENSVFKAGAAGVSGAKDNGAYIVLSVGSGEYHFDAGNE
jgi:alpha-L-rhamnosidase